MDFENTEVVGFEKAIKITQSAYPFGWEKLDTAFDDKGGIVELGANDRAHIGSLYSSTAAPPLFPELIFVYVDITAPMYWWNDFATFKIGNADNKEARIFYLTPFQITDFCFEPSLWCDRHPFGSEEVTGRTQSDLIAYDTVKTLEDIRIKFRKTGDRRFLTLLKELLPMGYKMQKHVILSYGDLRKLYHYNYNRDNANWEAFVEWLRELPYATEFILYKN